MRRPCASPPVLAMSGEAMSVPCRVRSSRKPCTPYRFSPVQMGTGEAAVTSTIACRVLRRDRVFQPAQVQRRQPLREPQRAARVATPVRVDRQPRVPVEHVVHGAHQVQRRLGPRRAGMDAQLQRPHAQALQFLGTPRVGGRRVRHAVVAGRVQRDPLPHPAAEELPDRRARGLAGQVPERHLHPADRAHHRALVEARPGHGRAHVAGQPLHVARVAVEQRAGQARVDRDAMDAGAVVRLPEPDQAGIGEYAYQHPGRTAHQHRTDPCDPHVRWIKSQTLAAET